MGLRVPQGLTPLLSHAGTPKTRPCQSPGSPRDSSALGCLQEDFGCCLDALELSCVLDYHVLVAPYCWLAGNAILALKSCFQQADGAAIGSHFQLVSAGTHKTASYWPCDG